jgi:hypothetical protein
MGYTRKPIDLSQSTPTISFVGVFSFPEMNGQLGLQAREDHQTSIA